MKLYEVSADLQLTIDTAMAIAEDNAGVIPDDLSAKIDALEIAKQGKILGLGRIYKNKSIEAEAISLEVKRLQKKIASLEKSAEWIKNYVACYGLKQGEKLSDGIISYSWRKSERTIVTDESKIPAQYLRIIPETKSPALDEIKKAIKSGVVIDGVQIEEKQNLQVK